jgi:hypothetical protein
MPTELTIVETVLDPIHAEILRGMLEARGLVVRLLFEPAARLDAVTCASMAEVELLVPAAQAAAARQLLADYWAACPQEQG